MKGAEKLAELRDYARQVINARAPSNAFGFKLEEFPSALQIVLCAPDGYVLGDSWGMPSL